MSYFHVRISVKGQRHDEVKLDVDEDTLESQFLAPYRAGTSITVNGKTIPIDRIQRIRISTSSDSGERLIAAVKAEDAQHPVAVLGGPSYAWRAAGLAENVTDQYITGPPGEESQPTSVAAASPPDAVPAATPEPNGTSDGRGVFLIAGRDNKAIDAIKAFLRALSLRVVEWEHAVAKTGLPSPYVGEVVEAGLRLADVALVLLTPDDIVHLRDDLLRDDDAQIEREDAGQARPNVHYEAGFADAIGRSRTVIVEMGSVKPFSDAAGRHVVRYDGSAAKRNALAERLRVAGANPDTSGSDWLSAGDL